MAMTVQIEVVASELGSLVLVADALGLRALMFQDERTPERIAAEAMAAPVVVTGVPNAHVSAARRWLGEYLAGRRPDPRAVTTAPVGTAYQRRVWHALDTIPYGTLWTYGDVARAAGGSPRSVGGANGRNPIAILCPCHRVVAGGPRLGGYGGGLGRKRWLLAREGVTPPPE